VEVDMFNIFEKQSGAREVKVRVTERGFEPARIRVARDETIALVVTRTTERTCARELVMEEYGVREELPTGKPVRISLTPKKSGPVKFGCAMGKMVSGVLDVV
jgi:plastocyanin domain-containing protein